LPVADPAAGAGRLVRRMSISRREFLRTLPEALGTAGFVACGDRFTVCAPGRTVEICFHEEAPLRVGSLTLPFARIELRFEGYGEAETAAAVKRFDLYFQRGGG
jgi:hypothetical protein